MTNNSAAKPKSVFKMFSFCGGVDPMCVFLCTEVKREEAMWGGGGNERMGDLATTGRGAEEVASYYEKHGYAN